MTGPLSSSSLSLSLDASRAAINRDMLAAARAAETAQDTAAEYGAYREAATRCRDLYATAPRPVLAELHGLALLWLAEDTAPQIDWPPSPGDGPEDERELAEIEDIMATRTRRHRAFVRRVIVPDQPQPHRRQPTFEGLPATITARRARVLDLLCLGARYKEIAAVMAMSEGGVGRMLTTLYTILDAHTRDDACLVWRQWCRQAGRVMDQDAPASLALVRAGQHAHTSAPQGQEPNSWPRLTARQSEVLALMADPRGLTPAQMALRLTISPHTLKHLMAAVRQALGVRNRREAVARFLAHEAEQEAAQWTS